MSGCHSRASARAEIAVRRLDHPIAFAAHRGGEKIAGIRIVVDDHDQGGMLGAVGDGDGRGYCPAAIGQGDRKRRALPGRALDGDSATEHLAEMLGDRETETGAAILPGRRRVGLAEGLEQPALLLLGHADPGIADDKGDFAGGRTDFEPDATVVGELPGIAQQIEKALLELGPVGLKGVQCLRQMISSRFPLATTSGSTIERTSSTRPARSTSSR